MAYRKRTLLDRILGYVRRRLLPHAAERAVLRSALSPAAGRQLSQTMSEGLPILNARDAEVVTEPAAAMFDTEKQALAREIRCLADGLFGGEEHPAGTLRNALVGFSRQMEKSDPRTNTAEMEKAL